MNIRLAPDMKKLVVEKVENGPYESPHDVVCEGLRLLEERDRFMEWRTDQLRKEVSIGLDQYEKGEYKAMTPSLMEDIKKKGRERLGL